jgi:hypothetical protein
MVSSSYRVTITSCISAGYFKRDFFCSTADMYELVCGAWGNMFMTQCLLIFFNLLKSPVTSVPEQFDL